MMMGAFLKKLDKLRVVFWIFLIIFVVVLLAVQVNAKLAEDAANMASLRQTEETRYPVVVETLSPSAWESWRSYYGQAKTARAQDVTSYVREVVRSVHVHVGDRVKAGDTVVTLLRSDHAAKARAGRTGYEEALLNYKRLLELSKKGGIAQSEVDKAYATLKNEEANAQASQSTLQKTELKSSINGVVSSRNVEPGEVAETGRSLITILDLSDMEVELMVSKKDIRHINRKTPVEILVDGTVSRGHVKRISPEAQNGSGLYPVVVGMPADSEILPGTYLEGRFMVERQDGVIVIPSDVVIYRNNNEYVYTAAGERAKMTEISTGDGRGGRVIVLSGLASGDHIITSGNRTLFDGALLSETKQEEH